MTAPRHVFYISDRTGLTAENIGEALLNQFGRIEFKRHTYPFIDTPEKARTVVEIVNRNAQENGLRPIAFVSVVNDEIREIIKKSGCFPYQFFRNLPRAFGKRTQHRGGCRRTGAPQYRQYTTL